MVEAVERQQASLDGTAVLRFAPHVKFRFDAVRNCHIVLAPERLLMPDEQAVEILKLVDGSHSIDGIIDDLAARFDAPRDIIGTDVTTMLRDLVDKGVLKT